MASSRHQNNCDHKVLMPHLPDVTAAAARTGGKPPPVTFGIWDPAFQGSPP